MKRTSLFFLLAFLVAGCQEERLPLAPDFDPGPLISASSEPLEFSASSAALPFEGYCNGVENDKITCDPNTGLEWLDLTETFGLTYWQMLDKLADDQNFAYYRYATSAEVVQLFANAGIDPPNSSSLLAENLVSVTDLQELVGVTRVVFSSFFNTTFTIADGMTGDAAGDDSRMIGVLQRSAEAGTSYLSNTLPTSTEHGHWLVIGCQPGSYSSEGACVLADRGYFVDTFNAEAQTACPPGTYQPLAGQTSCLSADPGYFVATSGATFQVQCPAGRYQPNSGSIECISADPGSFVATSGATSQVACAEGFTSEAGATSCFPINTAPVIDGITGLPVGPVPVGTSLQLSANFTDPDLADTHTATIRWGDGAEEEDYNVGEGARQFTVSHTYDTPGVYTVEVTVSDGAEVSNSFLYEFVVVYDPDGGFVIGAGWVDVPVGSYGIALTEGAIRFNFQTRYRSGQSRPDGNTRFQFRAGDMDFRSTSHDWLVVAGARAQYMGEGTINGVGGYCFLLTGIDGGVRGGGNDGVDRLRLKVWDCSDDSEVVFDNARGEADDGVPPPISRGNIRINP